MRSIALLALATMGVPMAAVAGGTATPIPEPVVETPVVVAPTRADGDWGGFYAGAQLGSANVTSPNSALGGTDVIGGLHVGYRYDLGRTVLGGEIDYDIANIDLDDGATDTTLDSVARLKLMAGLDAGRALFYVTGGAAFADATLVGASASGDGYFAGLGMDYAITDRLNLGAELLGHRFEDFDNTGVDIEAVTIQAKVAYRF